MQNRKHVIVYFLPTNIEMTQMYNYLPKRTSIAGKDKLIKTFMKNKLGMQVLFQWLLKWR